MSSGQRTKKQHFIPRFLLDNFKEESTGNVYAFDFERDAPLPPLPPTRLFARRFYYDHDNEVEDFLGRGIETPAAPVVQKLTRNGVNLTLEEHVALVKFVGAQLGRTPAARQEAESIMTGTLDIIIQELLAKNGYNEDEAKGVTAVPNNPRGLHAWRIAQASLSAFLFLDLRVAVLDNETEVPFIIGDHPVIQYNWFLRAATHLGALSMTAPGVQVIMPISRTKCLLLYDSNIYAVDEDQSGFVSLDQPVDVDLLNELQMLSRQRFVAASSGDQLEVLASRGNDLPPSSLIRFEQGIQRSWRDAGDGKQRDLIHNSKVQLDVGRWLSVSPIHDNAPPPPTEMVHRDPALLESYKRLESEMTAVQDSISTDSATDAQS